MRGDLGAWLSNGFGGVLDMRVQMTWKERERHGQTDVTLWVVTCVVGG